MSLSGRVHKWWYWQQMAKIDRHCAKHGHRDSGCYSVTGSTGQHCGYCGRIIWTSEFGKEIDPPRYQAPARRVDANWR